MFDWLVVGFVALWLLPGFRLRLALGFPLFSLMRAWRERGAGIIAGSGERGGCFIFSRLKLLFIAIYKKGYGST